MSIAEKLTTIAENEQEISNKVAEMNSALWDVLFNDAENYTTVIDEVYDKGRTDEWSEFWDVFQQNGARTDYGNGFYGSWWNNANFKPKYDIVPINARNLFHSSGVIDLIGILKKQGVRLDFSKATKINYLNQFGKIPAFGVIDARSCTDFSGTIPGENYSIKTIEKYILKEDGSQAQGGLISFWGAFALENITIEGVIGANVTFQHSSKLTYESLMSIINALYDYSGTTETRTLTLHATAKARLSEADIATATQKGWTIA